MHQNVDFSGQSLELHLFFARIMKEHSLFLKAGLTPVNTDFARETEYYKKEFERVLCCADVYKRQDSYRVKQRNRTAHRIFRDSVFTHKPGDRRQILLMIKFPAKNAAQKGHGQMDV